MTLQVLTNRRGTPASDRYDQLKIDLLPTSVSAALTSSFSSM